MNDHAPHQSSPPPPHLSEELRQGAADGSLAADRLVEVEEHVRACDTCAADLGRLKSLMKHIRDSESSLTPSDPLDALWPAIRSRIELQKLVPIAPTPTPPGPRTRTKWMVWVVGGLAAAAAILVADMVRTRSRRDDGQSATPVIARNGDQLLISAADSTRVYQQEARELLNRLELERAMLRPEAVAAIDHDLKIVDSAIAEVNAAIARDPNNPALRQLLASSYRRKVDVLKRIGNAG